MCQKYTNKRKTLLILKNNRGDIGKKCDLPKTCASGTGKCDKAYQ